MPDIDGGVRSHLPNLCGTGLGELRGLPIEEAAERHGGALNRLLRRLPEEDEDGILPFGSYLP